MADINEIMNNLYSDLKAVGQEVGRRTGDAVELSRLKLEHLKLKNRVRENYERLGEIVYGGYKNKEDVSDVIAVLYEQLDEDFANIERLFDAMNAVKAGYADTVSLLSEANWFAMQNNKLTNVAAKYHNIVVRAHGDDKDSESEKKPMAE